MRKQLTGLVAAALILVSVTTVALAQSQTPKQIVSSFKDLAAHHIASYDRNQHARVRLLKSKGNRWVRQWYTAEPNYSVDVQTTTSLVSPYIGIFQFTLRCHWSADWATREEAERDTTSKEECFPNVHRHTFAFQDGKWVPTERKSHVWGTVHNGWTDPSYNRDCDEPSEDGTTDVFGCVEDLTYVPAAPPEKAQPRRGTRRPSVERR